MCCGSIPYPRIALPLPHSLHYRWAIYFRPALPYACDFATANRCTHRAATTPSRLTSRHTRLPPLAHTFAPLPIRTALPHLFHWVPHTHTRLSRVLLRRPARYPTPAPTPPPTHCHHAATVAARILPPLHVAPAALYRAACRLRSLPYTFTAAFACTCVGLPPHCFRHQHYHPTLPHTPYPTPPLPRPRTCPTPTCRGCCYHNLPPVLPRTTTTAPCRRRPPRLALPTPRTLRCP